MSKILDSVIKDLNDRESKGIKEYGVTIDRSDYELMDWLQETYEETLDTALYLKAAIENILKNKNEKIF